MNNRITVIMPVYKSEKFVKEARDSVLAQTYRNFISIIINDRSTDESEDIIKKYSDKRINYEKNKTNNEIVYSLNQGSALAEADYIVRMIYVCPIKYKFNTNI